MLTKANLNASAVELKRGDLRRVDTPYLELHRDLCDERRCALHLRLCERAERDSTALIDLNLRAAVHLTHAVLPGMIGAGGGRIINIASDLAVRPLGNMSVYTATKFALRGFSLSLSTEVRPHNVRVTLVNPGMIDTAFGGGKEGGLGPDIALQPRQLAELVVELASQPAHQLVDEVTVHALGQDY